MQLIEHFFHNTYHSKHKKCSQVTTPDAFTFTEEILKRKTSLFLVLAVSKEMK